jgi:Flp pilus assembly protein TadD
VDPEPWRVLARVQLDERDVAAADAACEDLAQLDRLAAAAVLRELGSQQLDAQDPAGAERRLRRAVELAPADGEAWKLLARAQEAQDRLDQAREAWQRALVADPADAEALLSAGQLALRQKDLAGARALFRQLVEVAPDEATAKVRVAASWLDARQPDDALAAVGRGERPDLLYLRGLALLQLRRWKDAAEVLERVKPDGGEVFGYARVSLAHALSRAGRPGDAILAVKTALDVSPRDPALLFALGEAYDRAGRRDEALAQMRAVLAVKPDQADALNYLGYTYAERGERLEEAQAMLERAVRLEPDNAYFLDSLGWVLFKRGDAAAAVQQLERADQLSGPEPTILEHLGDAYLAAHRRDDAATAYRRALAAPDPPDDEPGVTPGTRRASLQRKLEALGARENG